MNNAKQDRGRWVRVGLLTLTMVGPIVNTIIERVRQRTQVLQQQAEDMQETVRSASIPALERLRVSEQARQLEKQAQQLRFQARRLRDEAQQRGGKVTQDWRKRGSEVTRDLAERSGQLLQSARSRNTSFWAIFGFSSGLVAAAVITYFFVRRRIVGQEAEQDQHIELPQDWALHSNSIGRPAGEIRHMSNHGAAVATLQAVSVDVDELETPADAVLVGIISTKHYYPVDTPFDHLPLSDDRAKDLVYFTSEEQAQAQGFTAAE